MKSKLRITLKIADRTYPLSIDPEQEEAYRQAAEEINQLVHSFEESYAVKDRQDSLAMCAIAASSRWFALQLSQQNQDTQTQQRMEKIHQLLDNILQE